MAHPKYETKVFHSNFCVIRNLKSFCIRQIAKFPLLRKMASIGRTQSVTFRLLTFIIISLGYLLRIGPGNILHAL